MRIKIAAPLVAAGLIVLSLASSLAQDTILHNFAGGSDDGGNPSGSLTLSGTKLYGMTAGGGSNNGGTVFSMNIDGSGFALLHSFSGGAYYGSLTLSGSVLYGMTSTTIFAINID